jgi:hypothetical protein
MNKNHSEIFPEFILPLDSLASEDFLPSEDSLAIKYSLPSEDSLASEDSFASEGFLPSEDSLAIKDSLASENSLAIEDSLASEDFLPSKNSIFSPEIDVDFLTGMPNNNTINARKKPKTSLSNATLNIHLSTDIPNHAIVTATVKVELNNYLKFLIEEELIDIVLQSSTWGMDRQFREGKRDDLLFYSPDQIITGDGTYTFSTVVPRSRLNEDSALINRRDEISTSISLVSFDMPLNIQIMTPVYFGYF